RRTTSIVTPPPKRVAGRKSDYGGTALRVAVIGAGTMGSGIAQACALADHEVKLVDLDEAALQRGQATIKGSLERLARKGSIEPGAVEAALGRVEPGRSFDGLQDAEVVIEAVYEAIDVKREVW